MLELLASSVCSGGLHSTSPPVLRPQRPMRLLQARGRTYGATHRLHAQQSEFFFQVPEKLDSDDDDDEPAAPSSTELQRWQRKRLETAYAAGKRKSNIKQLAGDLKMDRKDILTWFKERAKQPDPPGWPPAKPDAVVPEPKRFQAREEANDEAQGFADRQREPGGDYGKKRLGRAVEMTLEKVFERHRWPSQEMIGSICDLHPGVPAVRIKLWFEEARRRSPGGSRR